MLGREQQTLKEVSEPQKSIETRDKGTKNKDKEFNEGKINNNEALKRRRRWIKN